jgi:predicted nucleotidyltransferase
MDRMDDVQRLAEIFQRFPDVQAVYLFGSRATARAHTGSDLDLAIVPRHARLRERRLDILAELVRHGFCNVDLVFLDTPDIVLQYEAVRENRLVYQAEDFDRGTTYSRIVRAYLDFLPYLRVQREAYKRRILSGQARSDP